MVSPDILFEFVLACPDKFRTQDSRDCTRGYAQQRNFFRVTAGTGLAGATVVGGSLPEAFGDGRAEKFEPKAGEWGGNWSWGA